MAKSLTRTLYLIGLGLYIVSFILLGVSFVGSTTAADGSSNIGNPALFGIAIVMIFVSSVPMLIAWVGALVKMAQLQRWGWFICLLLLSSIALLVYIFAGPETPAPSALAVQGGMPMQQYPPYQQYPQQPQYPQYPQYPQQPNQYPQYPEQQQYPRYPQQPNQYPGQYPNENQPPYGAPPQGQGQYPNTSYPQNDVPPPPYS